MDLMHIATDALEPLQPLFFCRISALAVSEYLFRIGSSCRTGSTVQDRVTKTRPPMGCFQAGNCPAEAKIDDQAEGGYPSTSQVISTLRASTFQMFLQYSAIERSEEKKPVRAVFSSDIRFQCMRSVQA